MKKAVFTIAMLTLMAGGAWAQKSNVRDARAYLRDNEYKKAITSIDAAVANDETKSNADAWFVRGQAYTMLAKDSTQKSPNALDEATRSFMKTLELKPDYPGEDIDNPLYLLAYLNFQDGARAYSAQDFNKAYDKFMNVVSIYGVNGGKRFKSNVSFTELALSAKGNAALTAVNTKKDDQALKLYTELKTEQVKPDVNTYIFITEILNRQQKYDEMLAVITEAQKKFPDNKDFRNMELNYYISTGKADQLLPKLEAAVAADPSNSELLFNLGNSYEKVAFPKDGSGKTVSRPANGQELFTKAEDAYRKALNLKPENPDYNYNFGVLYYDVAVDYNGQMNEIKGMSAAETKKYNDLLAKRNASFAQARPYFEKAYMVLDSKGAAIQEDEKVTYKNAIVGLMEIYSRQDNKAKTDELKKKLDAIN